MLPVLQRWYQGGLMSGAKDANPKRDRKQYLRDVFDVSVGQLAVAYGVDVEDGLASILPAKPE